MKTLYFTLILLTSAIYSYAQQIPQYSQYMRNQFAINPAAAGIYDFTDITLCGRSQWSGFDNAPLSSFLSLSTILDGKYKSVNRFSQKTNNTSSISTGYRKQALGCQFQADQYGAFRKMQLSGTYAIHLPITRKINMSFGAKVGLSNNTFIQSRAVADNPLNDKTYVSFTSNNTGKNLLDIGSGLYVYSNKFYVGFSVDQLTKDKVNFGNSSTLNFDPKIYFNGIGGVSLNVNDNLTISPSFLIKYMSPAPLSIEGSIQVEYKKCFGQEFHTEIQMQ